MGLIFNHYSFVWATVPLLLLIAIIMFSRKPGPRDFVAVLAIALGFFVAWLVLHPVQSEDIYDPKDVQKAIGHGTPLLLEFQSAY